MKRKEAVPQTPPVPSPKPWRSLESEAGGVAITPSEGATVQPVHVVMLLGWGLEQPLCYCCVCLLGQFQEQEGGSRRASGPTQRL